MFAAFLTTVFFSLSAITGRRCAKALGGIAANFWRQTVAVTLLGLYVLFLGNPAFGTSFAAFFMSGLVGLGVGDLAFFQALPRIGARLTVLLINCLSVPVAALVEWLWLDQTLTITQLLCIILVLAGIWIALMPGRSVERLTRASMTGISFAVLAAIGSGISAVMTRKAFRLSTLAGQTIDAPTAAFERVLGGLLIAGLVILFVNLHPKKRSVRLSTTNKPIWPWVMATGLFGQTLGVTCFQWALKTQPAGVVLPIIALTPFVTIPISWMMEGERPSLRLFAGGTIAVAGVVLLLRLK